VSQERNGGASGKKKNTRIQIDGPLADSGGQQGTLNEKVGGSTWDRGQSHTEQLPKLWTETLVEGLCGRKGDGDRDDTKFTPARGRVRRWSQNVRQKSIVKLKRGKGQQARQVTAGRGKKRIPKVVPTRRRCVEASWRRTWSKLVWGGGWGGGGGPFLFRSHITQMEFKRQGPYASDSYLGRLASVYA